MAYIGPLIVSLNEYPGPAIKMESHIYIYSVNLLPRFSGWKEKYSDGKYFVIKVIKF